MSRVNVFVAASDSDETLMQGKLCPQMSDAWVEYTGSHKRVPCFLHFTTTIDGVMLNVWQTRQLTQDTPLDQVVDISLPSICLYPIIFQPEDPKTTPARIVRALSKLGGGTTTTATETSIAFRPADSESSDEVASEGTCDDSMDEDENEDDDEDELDDDLLIDDMEDEDDDDE